MRMFTGANGCSSRRVDPERQPAIVRRFAANLRARRHELGMTQAELSRAAKIALNYVGRLEAGTSSPGIDLLDRLAAALGAKLEDPLAGGEDRDRADLLRERAKALADELVAGADAETLRMLNPLLARLGESRRGG